MFKKILSLSLALLMVLGCVAVLASCGKKTERLGESAELLPRKEITSTVTVPSDFKIGLITLHDENSTYDKNFIDAFKAATKAMGIADENAIIVSNIEENEQCYNTAKDLVNRGCKVIFADSFGHEDHMIRAAKEFPEVQFCHATGTKAHTEALANYHNAFAAIYEGRYLAGIVAGMKLNEMIEAGKITADKAVMGYVGAFTYAEVISGLTSFYLGAKSVCSSVTMKVRFTGSWYDPGKEAEAASALIESDKCVLISQHADSLGAPTTCQKAGVPNVSYNGSTYSAGKDTWLVSSAINWAPYFQYIIEQAVKGEAIVTDWTGTIANNAVVLSGINQDVVAAGTKEALEAAIAKFQAGTLKVFATNTFTVKGEALTTYTADVDTDPAYEGDTEVISDGYFHESEYRSAPYFDITIDGIEFKNTAF